MPSKQELMRMLSTLEEKLEDEQVQLKDMSLAVREGEYSPVSGRETETEETLEILNQCRKANPILVGPAGAGKTAIAEAVAQVFALYGNRLPGNLKNSKLLSLSVTDLIADTGIVGELEKRIRNLTNQLTGKKAILFIDEIHTLFGAGAGGRSQADAVNLLKPLLSRDGLRIIGATTDMEYASIILSDPAFERRFTPVRVAPLSRNATVDAIRAYAKYRNIQISNEVMLERIVHLAQVVLPHRALPDSAIDLFERTASVSQLQGKKKIDESCLRHAALRAAHLSLDVTERLARVVGKVPSLKPIQDGLHAFFEGHRTTPVVFDCANGKQASQIAQELGDAVGGLIEIDISRVGHRELLGAEPGTAGYGERRPLHGLIEAPFSVLLIRGSDQAGEHKSLLDDLLKRGVIEDSRGRQVWARVIVTAPVNKDDKTIGFV